jgi:ABC-type sulfate/molybdate transport systems ATPase subunit
MADAPVLLGADQLTVRRGRRDVVVAADLQIRAGEVLAVLGPNGAGKSSLLSGLAGAVRPAAGRVFRNGRVALAAQRGVLADRTAIANVEIALGWWGVPRAERRDQALAALTRLGAAHLAARPARSLSGGERRRVHLARAVALDADVLLLDEPFTALDSETRDGLLREAGPVLREAARAIVVVVHDRGEAWALADRIAVMMAGRLVAVGTPSDVLASPPAPEVATFLGYTGRLTDGGGLVMTRPTDVRVDPAGTLAGRVRSVLRLEDGVRLTVAVPHGLVEAITDSETSYAVGDEVHVRVRRSIRFDQRAER